MSTEDKPSNIATWAATIVSFMATILAAYVFFNQQVWTLPANEIGDFIAGFGSLLGFIWIVVAYIRQGKELNQNTKALKLQVEELKLSVEAQKSLAKTATEEIQLFKFDMERRYLAERVSMRPKAMVIGSCTLDSNNKMLLILENTGETISTLAISSITKEDKESLTIDVHYKSIWEHGCKLGLSINEDQNRSHKRYLPNKDNHLEIKIFYTNKLKETEQMYLSIHISDRMNAKITHYRFE